MFWNRESGKALLKKVHDNFSVDNANRKSVMNSVLHKGISLQEPLAYLACAYAFLYLGSQTRKEALVMFEKYMLNPVETVDYDRAQIYLDMGKAYEGEYDFEKAEPCYSLYNKLSNETMLSRGYEIGPNLHLGRLYLKISAQKAVDFWKSQMLESEYIKGKSDESGFTRTVDVELKAAVDKLTSGYVYKPRKRK